MLGLNRYRVAVSAPDPQWQLEFANIASEIRGVTSAIDLLIEHIGSTSVPGLAAKPIVDIGILLQDPEAFHILESALSCVNLIYRGDKGSVGGRLFVRENGPEFRTHHVHVYFRGAPEWEPYLTFRNRLRASPSLRAEYETLKRELASVFSDDRMSYTEGKTSFVSRVLADASHQDTKLK